jgi:hypothetical protein
MSRTLCWALAVMTVGLLVHRQGEAGSRTDVNDIAESYVKLVLEIGLYDEVYVDAYFGPSEWRPPESEKQDPFPADRLSGRARELIARLAEVDAHGFTAIEKQRHAYLEKQLSSTKAKIELLAGRKMTFDEESKALYDAVAPARDEAYFQGLLDRLGQALPGDDDLYWRFNSCRNRFTVPSDKLERVLRALVSEYRSRTQEHIPLPEGERYDLQFVIAKPWGAAATYKGNGLSLIEVNFHMPFGVADIEKLAGHEIYPGHHLHLTLLDKNLLQDRKWMEYSVLPLHSPLALICEGLAEYGCKDLIMTTAERAEFDRRILLPPAGLGLDGVEDYQRVMELRDELDSAFVEGARRYLDGRMTRDELREWLRQYDLAALGGVENLIMFVEKYRTYVVTYTTGRQLVRDYIEKHSGPGNDLARRWQVFRTLLSTPQTPSGLMESNADKAPIPKHPEMQGPRDNGR